MARRRGSARSAPQSPAVQRVNYKQLSHPYAPQKALSEEGVQKVHDTALRTLEELGVRILHEEARKIFERAGARVDHDSQFVYIGRDMVEAALKTAPRSFLYKGARPEFDADLSTGRMVFSPGAGCPNVTDRTRGRRPGSLETYIETTKLHQSFDVIHVLAPSAEPQDIPTHLRHYETMRVQLTLSEKPIWVYSRGKPQTIESFEMIALGRGLSDQEFEDNIWCKTVINTNSPRQIDVPMAQGIIDFAKAKQLLVITPFCLAGAMAPISIAGALMLQHAETLTGITLAQLVRPGAPVMYGGFSSNVDMKSGAPAFGTPEHIKLSIGTGQMARHLNFPFRSAAGSAGVTEDMQSAGENHMGLWAQLQANTTLTLHAAGWLEGGLTFGYEKFINDVEALQVIAELNHPVEEDANSIGFDAVAEVEPGGHFFATTQTMDRYRNAFYDPLVADLDNFGTWQENGSIPSEDRATKIWQQVLADYQPPANSGDIAERIDPYIANHKAAGGAEIVMG